MDFHPIGLAKSHPGTVLFLMFIGFLLFTMVDHKAGGAISSRLVSLPIVGSLLA